MTNITYLFTSLDVPLAHKFKLGLKTPARQLSSQSDSTIAHLVVIGSGQFGPFD